MSAAPMYRLEQVEGHGLSTSSLTMRPTFRLVILAQDDVEAWTSPAYFLHAYSDKQAGGLRLSARNMLKRYERYHERTGRRFELEEAAKKAAKKKAERIAYLNKKLGELQAELDQLQSDTETVK